MHFFQPGGHFLLTATVDDGDLCPQPAGTARRVHGHVSAADHGYPVANLNGGIMLGEIVGFHEIDAGKEFIGGIYAAQALTRNVLEIG